jgi:hypothetical protein
MSGIAPKQNAFKFEIAPHKQKSTFVCINKKFQTGSCFHCCKHNDIFDRDGTYNNVTQTYIVISLR